MDLTDVRRHTPDLRGLVDIRLVTLEDGPGRGQRLLIARNAGGVCYEVAVDRGFDLSQFSFQGVNIGWHSPNQLRFPPFEPSSDEGWAFFRNFDGALATCGLDHFGPPASADIASLKHPHLTSVQRPLHGRLATERARLLGYGIDQTQESVWCEGIVRQASLFGEVLELRRRISLPIFGGSIKIDDLVTNQGFRPTDHAVLYHLNFGYPFLDDTTTLHGLDQAFLDDFHTVARLPLDDFGELVNIIRSDDLPETVDIALHNARTGIQVKLSYSTLQLPYLFIWRAYQSGVFALGVEPASHGGEAGTSQIAPGETRSYELNLNVSRIVPSQSTMTSPHSVRSVNDEIHA